MHLGQGVFTESLFCWKHCAKNKESLQLSRQDCFRPECRAWTYWLFMASVHSQCPRSSLYQFVKYFECCPYTTHKEFLGIFRHIIHICFLKAVLPHLCGKYLVNIYFPLNIPQRTVNSYLVLWILQELKDTLEKQFRKYVVKPCEAEYLFGAHTYSEANGKMIKEVTE